MGGMELIPCNCRRRCGAAAAGTADVGRDVGAGLKRAVVTDEQIGPLADAHHRQRLVALAGEDHRVAQPSHRELADGQRHHVGVGGEAERAVHPAQADLAVQLTRERLGLGIEQDIAGEFGGGRQLGRGIGHVDPAVRERRRV